VCSSRRWAPVCRAGLGCTCIRRDLRGAVLRCDSSLRRRFSKACGDAMRLRIRSNAR
jgi:hypothetical protein